MGAMTDFHSYRPSQGHGLAHDPLNAIIAPRPIGWVATQGRDGQVNLAPYSFFNMFSYRPPLIGFCSTGGEKDSLRNVREVGEFTWNLVTRPLAEQMNATSAPVAYGVDEFELAGLGKLASTLVRPPRVAESRVQLECVVTDILRLRDRQGGPTSAFLTIGEVVAVHIDRTLLQDGVFDSFAAGIVLRGGGPTAYAVLEPGARFDMVRPG